MLLSDLDDLEDILDDILPKEDENEDAFYFNEKEECEVIETIMMLMYDYIQENPTEIAEPDFHESMIENVKELFSPMLIPDVYSISDQDVIHDDLDELIETATHLFYNQIIPYRSYSSTFVKKIPTNEQLNKLKKQIDYLAGKPQPQQRTSEWYTFRHNLITASNAYKAFENSSAQNQLIYEKCQPITIQSEKSSYVNVDSPLHWGQKYEPISVMYYEKEYNTRVGDFGCIQHSQFSFLGASPDGINNDISRPNRFGRMLEIKNIVNREIDGIPKKEYWIQMQLQMETCDLNECDFLETRFKEYETETEFLNDSEDNENNKNNENISFTKTIKGELKGIIMYFSSNDGKPRYIYKPLDMEAIEFEKWSETKIEENNELCWIKNIYWRLEEVSCVLVLRNQKWFADNIKQIENIWSIIEKERKTGEYVNRAPNKRVKKVDTNTNTPTNTIESYFNVNKKNKSETNGCLILLNKNKSTCQSLSTYENINTVIRIRTESMDETKQTYDI